jgi:hypothetical protein
MELKNSEKCSSAFQPAYKKQVLLSFCLLSVLQIALKIMLNRAAVQ